MNCKYQLWLSSCIVEGETIVREEGEFFLAGFDTVKEARRQGRKMQSFPGISAAWVVRSKDGEVVQPHEKF